MPKSLNFTRSDEELGLIAKAIKSDKRPEVRQRAMGLRLLHEGHSPQEVANLSAVSAPTVYDWHHRFQNSGVAGLANRPRSGRPPKANEDYVEQLEKVIEQDPQELGYAFTIWTASRLEKHMAEQTGISLRPTQFRALLKANDFVYRRPTHDLTNLQDAEARKAAEEWLEGLKKVPKQERLTFSLWTKAP